MSDDTAPPPAFMDADEIAPRTRRSPIQREWAVQRGVKFFVKRAVAVEHEFAAHDRGPARSAMEHIGEADRGIRRSWMDTELAVAGGATFRCELKAPGVKIDPKGEQLQLIHRMCDLGHPTDWANSVVMYGERAEVAGVPLRRGWSVIAKMADELVAADIRKQEVKAEKKRNGTLKVRKPRAARVAPSRIARFERARGRTL